MTGARQRVLLVRPWRGGHPGGCCAGDPADLLTPPGGRATRRPADHPAGSEQFDFAALYSAVRAGLPATVAVEVVDPRNTVFLLPAIVRDARRRGRSWRTLARSLVTGTAPGAILVDGELISRGEPPPPTQALTQIRRALSR
ncbi:hypothetical protein JQS43_16350 [Natronosporangium hydrolyticum]|uniref:Uncharacterized protein n=1 Tax=Natronosporangium hydrolyticum TaxID=2811111 RepID=A0A895YA66_9ACTN|nr:hypothetical protein [Natronosporangium hydrolyticum]QSB13195.1 hypothetical protein JQS43_16350 [Natronosporangium hydrolyticum]